MHTCPGWAEHGEAFWLPPPLAAGWSEEGQQGRGRQSLEEPVCVLICGAEGGMRLQLLSVYVNILTWTIA